METDVTFKSDSVELAATFYAKDGVKGRMPGIVLGHGFAGARYPKMANYLANLGYGVLSIDFRGYGKSGGVRGRVVPREQVSDFKNSVSYLAQRSDIDPDRIGIIGSSLGGSIAVMAAADDPRMKVCVAGCPIYNGDVTLRILYNTQEKFDAFLKLVEEKRRRNETIPRFSIVNIPEPLRANLPKDTPMEFYADTVDGFLSLNPKEVVTRIAPRPVFVIHAKDDHVVPVKDAEELVKIAGSNCDLELLEKGDHFIFGLDPVIASIGNWLVEKLPPKLT
ncbi:MAG: alpha/beta hydrolase [Acidobacteriota bacterium]